MKILLISAINPIVETESRYPQLGLGYLVSYIRKELGQDRFQFKIITDNIEDNLNRFKPDLVGISSFSQNYRTVKKYASICKDRNLPVIVGGIHISLMPESFSTDMDVGVLQEGEQTMAELVDLYEKTQRFEADDLSKVKGIVYHRENQLLFTEPRPFINNLDDIPFPARELLDIRSTHLSMFTSRGCPYRCVFCASSRFWTKTRFASAEYVAEEIKELYHNYGAKLISFYDDLFIVNKKRLSDLIEILALEGLLGKVRFSCSARANLINDETARLLKELGVISVALGLESGHPRTLKYLKGPSVTVNDNANAVKILDQNGIAPNAAFVIGSPTETREEIMATYDFIKSVPLRNFNVYVMTPFPGTPIWTYAEEQQLLSKDFDQWEILDAVHFDKYYKTAVIVSQKLSRKELYKIYKKFVRLRYLVFLKNAYRHPFIRDVPKMAMAMAKEKVLNVVRK
jgi:anaerobic magnesium-protoporphyrin IX monomethyl ester cyclase